MGRGLQLVLGLKAPPGSFYIFIFFSSFLFLFSISFVTFANMLQINSTHFHKFCKIHSKV
jgi:hypothetical protein